MPAVMIAGGVTVIVSRRAGSQRSSDQGVNIGDLYGPQDGRIAATATLVSQPDGDKATRRRNKEDDREWYAAISADMFG